MCAVQTADSYMVGHAFSAVTMTFLQPDGLSVIHIPLKARHSARSHATYTGGS